MSDTPKGLPKPPFQLIEDWIVDSQGSIVLTLDHRGSDWRATKLPEVGKQLVELLNKGAGATPPPGKSKGV